MKVLNMVRLFGRPIRITRSDGGAEGGKRIRETGIGAKLWIGGLSPEVDEKILHDTFSAFGALSGDAHIARDPTTGNSRGFGFCEYESFEGSDLAIESMHGRHLAGRPIQVQYAMKQGSRERHGSNAERMLAAARKPERTLQPHTMFAASPDEIVQPPQQSAGSALSSVAAKASARPDVAVAGAGGVGTGVASLPPTALGMRPQYGTSGGMGMGMGMGPPPVGPGLGMGMVGGSGSGYGGGPGRGPGPAGAPSFGASHGGAPMQGGYGVPMMGGASHGGAPGGMPPPGRGWAGPGMGIGVGHPGGPGGSALHGGGGGHMPPAGFSGPAGEMRPPHGWGMGGAPLGGAGGGGQGSALGAPGSGRSMLPPGVLPPASNPPR